ncbi:hypothetical protein NDU88_007689 [Pleurodeles waltl]|uniref:Uncharacterized protein n=1 Tax=Pleurodeles waltl TaxID=8319 RepID=A0AAV7PS62_PLEWA|nr:hypothetical protein NDU88_007689 [Pleurodeles waltl]
MKRSHGVQKPKNTRGYSRADKYGTCEPGNSLNEREMRLTAHAYLGRAINIKLGLRSENAWSKLPETAPPPQAARFTNLKEKESTLTTIKNEEINSVRAACKVKQQHCKQ